MRSISRRTKGTAAFPPCSNRPAGRCRRPRPQGWRRSDIPGSFAHRPRLPCAVAECDLTPKFWVGTREKITPQLRLGLLKEALGESRGDRLPGGLDAHLLCELPAKRSAVEGAVTLWAVALWTMARWNGPLARGIDSSVATLMAPADCPKTVILLGSPPNASIRARRSGRGGPG